MLRDTTPAQGDPVERAIMNCLFSTCRFMDDTALMGVPASIDAQDLFRDERCIGGSDAVYPVKVADDFS